MDFTEDFNYMQQHSLKKSQETRILAQLTIGETNKQ